MSSDAASPTPDPANEWTVKKVLEWTTGHLKKHGSDTPRLDAEILLAKARGCQRIQLYTAYDQPLTDDVRATMRELVQRRAQAEPVAYLVGHREFFSLDFQVTRDVLIPRPDTETLVIEIIDEIKRLTAAKDLAGDQSAIRVLDLCTGSGCVAIAAAKHCQTAKLNVLFVATDISPAALAIARDNATKHGVHERIEFREGNLFEAVPKTSGYEIIASNPPYIATAEIDTLDPEVARHEPRLALDGGPSGFDIIDQLLAKAAPYAVSDTVFLMEISPEQSDAVMQRLIRGGSFTEITMKRDLVGRPRVAKARLSNR